MAKIYVVQVNFDFCEFCWDCEKILKGFRSVHGGNLYVSEAWYEKEEVREACKSLIDACPRKAITIRAISPLQGDR